MTTDEKIDAIYEVIKEQPRYGEIVGLFMSVFLSAAEFSKGIRKNCDHSSTQEALDSFDNFMGGILSRTPTQLRVQMEKAMADDKAN